MLACSLGISATGEFTWSLELLLLTSRPKLTKKLFLQGLSVLDLRHVCDIDGHQTDRYVRRAPSLKAPCPRGGNITNMCVVMTIGKATICIFIISRNQLAKELCSILEVFYGILYHQFLTNAITNTIISVGRLLIDFQFPANSQNWQIVQDGPAYYNQCVYFLCIYLYLNK